MSNTLPTVSVIIPTRPGQSEIKSFEAAQRLDYPRERIEFIIARGKQPAIQRNVAVKEARGDIIYFLDDDSEVQRDALLRAVEHFRDASVQMVGGPNLCPADAPFLERVFAIALGSWIAFGPSRARYDRVGTARATSEKELILCNLLARRQTISEADGFDESLYPNEENALMDELQRRGGKLMYDPNVIVFRRPRPTLRAFCKMLLNYGRGRAEQFRLHPTAGSVLNFVPPLFVLYLITLMVIPVVAKTPSFRTAVALPLVCYGLGLLAQTFVSAMTHGFVRSICALPMLVITHVFYGLGFLRGLIAPVKHAGAARTTEVQLEHVQQL